MDTRDLQQLQNKMHRLFIYRHDDKNYGVPEHWQSHAQSLKENRQFQDDCDGFAFTVCETLINQGAQPSQVKFIICETETGEGHAVAGITLNDTTWILENRFREIYDWNTRTDYQWRYYMNFAEPGQWYQITSSPQA